ncbi:MAG: hypothetical protein SVZ03_07670 [Spirochaetota bacterium]|nr:hypothetical protein [Spirochaetota bacterium]
MKKIIILLCFLMLLSCSSSDNRIEIPEVRGVSPEKNIETHTHVDKVKCRKADTIPTGWIDEDTYNVRVIGGNEEIAINKAKHRILKDIVNVRMKNRSRYTDIVKIKEEFAQPLKKGKIINSNNVDEGIEIYYQIKGKGLKKKFEIK